MSENTNTFESEMEGEKEVIIIDRAAFDALNQKVNDMHRALLGDEYGNHGFKQRLENVEKKTKDFEKKGWMVYGGSVVIGFIIAKGKAILALLTGN